MESLLCTCSPCLGDIGIHQAWQLFPESLQVLGKQDTRVCKQVRQQAVGDLGTITRKFMASPEHRAQREGLGGRFSLGCGSLERFRGGEKAVVVSDVDLEG